MASRSASCDGSDILVNILQWREYCLIELRLNLFVSALKYPTVYGTYRDVIVQAAKVHPQGVSVKAPGDIWAVLDWLYDAEHRLA